MGSIVLLVGLIVVIAWSSACDARFRLVTDVDNDGALDVVALCPANAGDDYASLFAYRVDDGAELWEAKTVACSHAMRLGAPPLYRAGNHIVVRCDSGSEPERPSRSLIAVHELDGPRQWSKVLGRPSNHVPIPVVAADDTLLAPADSEIDNGSVGATLFSLDVNTGRTKWTASLPESVMRSPVLSEDAFLFPGVGGVRIVRHSGEAFPTTFEHAIYAAGQVHGLLSGDSWTLESPSVQDSGEAVPPEAVVRRMLPEDVLPRHGMGVRNGRVFLFAGPMTGATGLVSIPTDDGAPQTLALPDGWTPAPLLPFHHVAPETSPLAPELHRYLPVLLSGAGSAGHDRVRIVVFDLDTMTRTWTSKPVEGPRPEFESLRMGKLFVFRLPVRTSSESSAIVTFDATTGVFLRAFPDRSEGIVDLFPWDIHLPWIVRPDGMMDIERGEWIPSSSVSFATRESLDPAWPLLEHAFGTFPK